MQASAGPLCSSELLSCAATASAPLEASVLLWASRSCTCVLACAPRVDRQSGYEPESFALCNTAADQSHTRRAPKLKATTSQVGRDGLDAFAVHNRRAALIILGLRDPHLLEGAQ